MAKKDLSGFTPQRRNANKHTQRGLGMLTDAMRRSGYVAPMTATADGEVIDGSARLEVAEDVFGGVEPLVIDHDGTRPVIMRRTDIPDASDPRAKRIAIEANRIAAVDLDWDPEILAQFAAGEPEILAGLWRDDELAAILAGLDLDATGGSADAEPQIDRAAELAAKWGTETGQVWTLGKHRLAVGDCTDAATVAWLLDGSKPPTLVFDPPWDVGAVPPTEWESALVFTDGRRIGESLSLFGAPAWAFVWDCVSSWFTPNRPLQRCKIALWYGSVGNYCPDGWHYGDAGDARRVTNSRGTYWFEPDARGKHLADVFSEPITKLHSDSEHPHTKPLDWVTMLIGNCSNGNVYDPFVGSGTTIIAAENLGRRCFACEIDPGYAAVTLERFSAAFPGLPIAKA